jgi:hypothetical protein
MIRTAFAALVGATTAAVGAQQGSAPADPVVVHFREYRAALDRDDVPAAEAAAAEALAASEAASGRRTAVLALNLANLRLELGAPYDALPPARTAHALAVGSADSGVDPSAAALTLGRAELAAGDGAGSARLLEAFTAAEGNAALETEVYLAAVALGVASLDAKDYPAARRAWATAGRLARTTDEPTLARARALTGEGAAIFLASADRALPQPAGRELSNSDARAASDAFAIAQRLLMPAAFAATEGGALTAGQIGFAQAMAWQSALFARIQSAGAVLPPLPPLGADVPPFDQSALCKLRTVTTGAEIEYPPEALSRYGVGAVVVHIGLDSSGAAASRRIAAAIPPGVLADAVQKVVGQWTVEKDPTSAPNCSMPPSTYVNVRFVLE